VRSLRASLELKGTCGGWGAQDTPLGVDRADERGRTAASPLCHALNSVRPYACSALAGLERLQADLCRPLEPFQRAHPR